MREWATIEPEDLPLLPGGAGPEEWAGTTAPDRRFMVPHWIVRGAAGLLGGQDGVGKSLLGQQLATSAAAKVPFLGLPVERVKALYLTCEDPLEELQRRQEAINRAQGLTMEQLRGWLRVHSLKGQLGNELATFDGGRLTPTDRYRQLRETALNFEAQLVLVDNAAHVFAGNENARHEVAAFLGLLERLSEEIDGAVILLAHPNKQHGQGHKQGNEYSGTTGWSAHVRNRLFFDWTGGDDGPADPDERVLRRSKANYAARGEEIRCRWFKGAFVRDEDLPADLAGEIAATAAANNDNDIFLTCLRERTRQSRAVSEKHSPTFAPSEFAKMSEAKGLSKARLEAAMNRLFRLGAIERAELWKGPDRKPVYGLRETAGNAAVNGAGDVRGTPGVTAAADCAGNAGETHTVPKGTNGAALGAAAPANQDCPF
jgi:RecA-family ATPase